MERLQMKHPPVTRAQRRWGGGQTEILQNVGGKRMSNSAPPGGV